MFEQDLREVVVTCRAVMTGQQPVRIVCHYPGDDGWAFLDGQSFLMDAAQLVTLGSLLEQDTTLHELADLPAGWSAQRSEPGEPWQRYEDAELNSGD